MDGNEHSATHSALHWHFTYFMHEPSVCVAMDRLKLPCIKSQINCAQKCRLVILSNIIIKVNGGKFQSRGLRKNQHHLILVLELKGSKSRTKGDVNKV